MGFKPTEPIVLTEPIVIEQPKEDKKYLPSPKIEKEKTPEVERTRNNTKDIKIEDPFAPQNESDDGDSEESCEPEGQNIVDQEDSKPNITKEAKSKDTATDKPSETTPLNNIDEGESTLPKFTKNQFLNQPRPASAFGEYGQ